MGQHRSNYGEAEQATIPKQARPYRRVGLKVGEKKGEKFAE